MSSILTRRLHYAGRGMIGKNHLATTLAYEACLTGHRVLFTPDIDIVNVELSGECFAAVRFLFSCLVYAL